jgi:uncharacterized protein YbaP (TraB family)
MKTPFQFAVALKAMTAGFFGLAFGIQTNAQQTLLFEISKSGQPTSYIYGTMHMKDQNFIDCEDKLAAYVKKANVFSGELDLNDVQPTAELAMSMLMVTTSLKGLYTEADYKKVKAHLEKKLGQMAGQIEMMKPFWIMSTLTAMNQEDNMKREDIVDIRLQAIAEKAGLEVKALETLEEQLAAINAISLKEQAKMLLESIEQEEDDMTEKIRACYAKSDLSCLEAVYNEQAFDSGAEAALITGRNKTMADRLASMMKEGKSVFSAVGALHLPGENGVIALLKAKGYTVKPVYYLPCK